MHSKVNINNAYENTVDDRIGYLLRDASFRVW